MNVLLIGSGGREHALAWRLSQSPLLKSLYAMPGNPGMEPLARLSSTDPMDFDAVERFVRDQRIDLVVIGPEDPLAAGLADRLHAAGVKVFGPKRAAARIESDKWFAKELMRHQAIPTAEARLFTDADAAQAYIEQRDQPLVIKAAGLAKGKGVSVCYRTSDALEAIDRIMRQKAFGPAGTKVVVEEMLTGPECSILAFVDRRSIYIMESSQDHKPVDDGDTGPMTGGMGAYSPTPVVTSALLEQIERDILVPIVDGLVREGIDYKGVLYAGLMLTPNGPKVLEFNCRFGDPETQPLMMRLRSDLLEIMLAVADGKLDRAKLDWDPRPALCVIAASGGYPGKYPTGLPISGLDQAGALADVQVFHSGTARRDGRIVTAGGRVLGITAIGADLAAARRRADEALRLIHFDGMHHRTDIGWQALKMNAS